ncbi:MAG: RsmE family RNA methyltransferase [Eubacteriales bacterium]|nr:RsmE family RNA methyltransferase [Eubacteriales bacterium]
MHRFYSEEKLNTNTTVFLDKEESHHAIKVLRLHINDEIELLDGENIYLAKITSIEKNAVGALCIKQLENTAPDVQITLYQGFPKGDKYFTIVQKCTEVGVNTIVPVLMERSVKKGFQAEKIVDKSKKLAIEACKQCGLNKIPNVKSFHKLDNMAEALKKHDLLLVAWEEEQETSLLTTLKKNPTAKSIGLIIGPEGGIDPQEIAFLKQHNAQSIGLGKRILRTETAGVCTVFTILSHYENE